MKIKLLIAVAALFATSFSYAEINTGEHLASGDIDLTLDLGDSGGGTQEFIVEANLDGGGNSVNLEAAPDGVQTKLNMNIGSISYIGEELGSDVTCQVNFTGSNSPVNNFYQLLKSGGTAANSINYYLKLESILNEGTQDETTQSDNFYPNSALTVIETENSCSINITNIIIHSDDDLTDKNGVYTDTLTYTMTAI